MNICLITSEYPPVPCGGVGTYVQLTAALLAARGHNVHVLTKGTEATPERAQEGERLWVHRVRFLDEQGRSVWSTYSPFVEEMVKERSYVGVFQRYVAQLLPSLIREARLDLLEFQDIEAPGYTYLNQRLYLPDVPDIPAVVRLHGLEEDCVRANGGDPWSRHNVHRFHYEHGSAALADGLSAPCQFYARQVGEKLGLPPGRIAVYPYPFPAPPAGADEAAPAGNDILLAGRLERRKGGEVLIPAFARLKKDHPRLRLRFIGRDTIDAPTGRSFKEGLLKLVPREYAGDVLFEDFRPREELFALYTRAAVVAVPSTWDNYPYVCLEAMSAGGLIVTTDGGGMMEMIEDGRSGFVAPRGDVEALAAALDRALRLPPEQAEAVRRAARERVKAITNEDDILERQLAFYRETIERHARETDARSLPGFWPHAHRPATTPHPRRGTGPTPARGTVSVLLPCYNLGPFLGEALASVEASTRRPDELIILDDGSTDPETLAILDRLRGEGRRVERHPNQGLAATRNIGAKLASGDYLVFLDADDRLAETYLDHAARVLDRFPEAAAVCAWVQAFGAMGTLWAPFHASFPFLLYENQFSPAAMVRRRVFLEAGGQRTAMRFGYEDWDFWIRLAQDGWALFTMPETGIHYRIRAGSMLQSFNRIRHVMMRQRMIDRFGALFSEYGPELMGLADRRREGVLSLADQEELEQWRLCYRTALAAPRHPLAAARFFAPRLRNSLRRLFSGGA